MINNRIAERFLTIVLMMGTGMLTGCHKQTSPIDTPEGKVRLIEDLKPQINQKLAAIHSDDQTDQSPVAQELIRIHSAICDDESVKPLGVRCYINQSGDGLMWARWILSRDIVTIIQKTNAQEDPDVLEDRLKALASVQTQLDRLPQPDQAGLVKASY